MSSKYERWQSKELYLEDESLQKLCLTFLATFIFSWLVGELTAAAGEEAQPMFSHSATKARTIATRNSKCVNSTSSIAYSLDILYKIYAFTKADSMMNQSITCQNFPVLISSLMYARNWSKRSTAPIHFLYHFTMGQMDISFKILPFADCALSPLLAGNQCSTVSSPVGRWQFINICTGRLSNQAAYIDKVTARAVPCGPWIFLQFGLLSFGHCDPFVETFPVCSDCASGIYLHLLQVFEERDTRVIVKCVTDSPWLNVRLLGFSNIEHSIEKV